MMNGTDRQVLEEKLDFFMNQHGTTHFLNNGDHATGQRWKRTGLLGSATLSPSNGLATVLTLTPLKMCGPG